MEEEKPKEKVVVSKKKPKIIKKKEPEKKKIDITEYDFDYKAFEKTYGAPPYNFQLSSEQIPITSVQRKKRYELDQLYIQKNPHPNYQSFGRTEFVDSLGREYRTPKNEVERNQSIIISQNDRNRPKDWDSLKINPYAQFRISKQILFVRLPRSKLNLEPPKIGENLKLWHNVTSLYSEAVVKETYFRARRKTGYIIIKDWHTKQQLI